MTKSPGLASMKPSEGDDPKENPLPGRKPSNAFLSALQAVERMIRRPKK